MSLSISAMDAPCERPQLSRAAISQVVEDFGDYEDDSESYDYEFDDDIVDEGRQVVEQDGEVDAEFDLEASRAQLDHKLKSRFEAIFEKYGKDFTGIGDEIDLRTGEIVVDNGHLVEMMDERDAGDTENGRTMLRAFTVNPDETAGSDADEDEEQEPDDGDLGDQDNEYAELSGTDPEPILLDLDDLPLGQERHQSPDPDNLSCATNQQPSRVSVPADPDSVLPSIESISGSAIPSEQDILAQFGPELGQQIINYITQQKVISNSAVEPAWQTPALTHTTPGRRPILKSILMQPSEERSPSPETSVWAPHFPRGRPRRDGADKSAIFRGDRSFFIRGARPAGPARVRKASNRVRRQPERFNPYEQYDRDNGKRRTVKRRHSFEYLPPPTSQSQSDGGVISTTLFVPRALRASSFDIPRHSVSLVRQELGYPSKNIKTVHIEGIQPVVTRSSRDFDARRTKARSGRRKLMFTPADDEFLLNWVARLKLKGGESLWGKANWESIGDENPRHSWGSWEIRYRRVHHPRDSEFSATYIGVDQRVLRMKSLGDTSVQSRDLLQVTPARPKALQPGRGIRKSETGQQLNGNGNPTYTEADDAFLLDWVNRHPEVLEASQLWLMVDWKGIEEENPLRTWRSWVGRYRMHFWNSETRTPRQQSRPQADNHPVLVKTEPDQHQSSPRLTSDLHQSNRLQNRSAPKSMQAQEQDGSESTDTGFSDKPIRKRRTTNIFSMADDKLMLEEIRTWRSEGKALFSQKAWAELADKYPKHNMWSWMNRFRFHYFNKDTQTIRAVINSKVDDSDTVDIEPVQLPDCQRRRRTIKPATINGIPEKALSLFSQSLQSMQPLRSTRKRMARTDPNKVSWAEAVEAIESADPVLYAGIFGETSKARQSQNNSKTPANSEHLGRPSGPAFAGYITNNSDLDEDDEENSIRDGKTCFCQEEEYGDMIGCDNEDCPHEWFHWGCVGITSVPDGSWFCSVCSSALREPEENFYTQSDLEVSEHHARDAFRVIPNSQSSATALHLSPGAASSSTPKKPAIATIISGLSRNTIDPSYQFSDDEDNEPVTTHSTTKPQSGLDAQLEKEQAIIDGDTNTQDQPHQQTWSEPINGVTVVDDAIQNTVELQPNTTKPNKICSDTVMHSLDPEPVSNVHEAPAEESFAAIAPAETAELSIPTSNLVPSVNAHIAHIASPILPSTPPHDLHTKGGESNAADTVASELAEQVDSPSSRMNTTTPSPNREVHQLGMLPLRQPDILPLPQLPVLARREAPPAVPKHVRARPATPALNYEDDSDLDELSLDSPALLSIGHGAKRQKLQVTKRADITKTKIIYTPQTKVHRSTSSTTKTNQSHSSYALQHRRGNNSSSRLSLPNIQAKADERRKSRPSPSSKLIDQVSSSPVSIPRTSSPISVPEDENNNEAARRLSMRIHKRSEAKKRRRSSITDKENEDAVNGRRNKAMRRVTAHGDRYRGGSGFSSPVAGNGDRAKSFDFSPARAD